MLFRRILRIISQNVVASKCRAGLFATVLAPDHSQIAIHVVIREEFVTRQCGIRAIRNSYFIIIPSRDDWRSSISSKNHLANG